MKNSLLGIFAMLLLALSFSACEQESASSVDQNTIYTIYELYYDQNVDKTYARATFKFSNVTGTNLELDNGGSIVFNNAPLTYNPLLAYYEKEYAGLLPSGVFQYVDLDSNSFVNTAEIRSIGLPADVDSISRSASFNLNWTGNALAANESVVAGLNNANAINPQLFYQNDVGSTGVILAKNQLEKLFAGPAILGIERRYSPAIQQATSAGGSVTGRYKPSDKSVVLY